MVVSKPRILAVLALLILIPSLALQILVSLGIPFIKQIYFLQVVTVSGQTLHFGLWTNCLRSTPTGVYTCASTGLGYQQSLFRDLVESAFEVGLPVALVVQPIATGFTALASFGAAAAVLGSGRSVAWPLLASLAAATAAAALAVELVMFIQAKDKFLSTGFSVLGSDVQDASFGSALWIEVAAVAVAILAALFLIASFALRKRTKRALRDDAAFYDFEPTRPSIPPVSDMAYYPADDGKLDSQHLQQRQYQPSPHDQYQLPPMQHHPHELDPSDDGGGGAYALTTDEAQLSPYGAAEGVDAGADYGSESQYGDGEHDGEYDREHRGPAHVHQTSSSTDAGPDMYGSASDMRRPSYSSRTPLTYEPRARRYSERGAF